MHSYARTIFKLRAVCKLSPRPVSGTQEFSLEAHVRLWSMQMSNVFVYDFSWFCLRPAFIYLVNLFLADLLQQLSLPVLFLKAYQIHFIPVHFILMIYDNDIVMYTCMPTLVSRTESQ